MEHTMEQTLGDTLRAALDEARLGPDPMSADGTCPREIGEQFVRGIRSRGDGRYDTMRDYVTDTLAANIDDPDALADIAFVLAMRVAQVIEREECGMNMVGESLSHNEMAGLRLATMLLCR